MDKETGEAVKDAEGKEITAETSFKPETADGTVNETFTFDGSNLAGKTIVVFESLERNDTVYAVHTDINDEAQTIYIPEIGTTAKMQHPGHSSGRQRSYLDRYRVLQQSDSWKRVHSERYPDGSGTGESVKVGGQEVIAETTFKPKKLLEL